MGSVNVGYEVGCVIAFGIGIEASVAMMGTADDDVNDGGDGFASVARPEAGADGAGELGHVCEDGEGFWARYTVLKRPM
jgi:hypothetical protein